MSLIHFVYTSAASPTFDAKVDLPQILRRSRANNAARDITGMLLYTEGCFFQVLEGDDRQLDALFATITRDSRHQQVTQIIREVIAVRAFGDWTMGFSEMTCDDIATLVGTNDFFAGGSDLCRVDSGRAKRLLAAFAKGRWRSRVQTFESRQVA